MLPQSVCVLFEGHIKITKKPKENQNSLHKIIIIKKNMIQKASHEQNSKKSLLD